MSDATIDALAQAVDAARAFRRTRSTRPVFPEATIDELRASLGKSVV